MKYTFFGRRIRIFGTVAVLILCVIFFMVPFALRGARMSLQRMKNDVKDWLPSDFPETRELAWFGEHFVGERFIVMTWPGCTTDDERFHLMVEKLRGEVVPHPVHGRVKLGTAAAAEPAGKAEGDNAAGVPEAFERARQTGDRLGLFATGDYHTNWGGLDEKWLQGGDDRWYYLLPDGQLFRWEGGNNVLGATMRSLQRSLGYWQLEGEYVATFSADSAVGEKNPFYADPRKVTARLFNSVRTGPQVVDELASEGGPLWPIGNYSQEEKRELARKRALRRLTGTLFGPPVPLEFDWTVAQFREFVSSDKLAQLPGDWETQFRIYVEQLVEDRYEGNRAQLLEAPLEAQTEHWQDFFAQLDLAPPARLTCIVVTLSEAGKRNLQHVIGRPILGQPQGRLLDLATTECGIPLEDLKLGGPPVDNVAIDEEGTITLVRLVGFSIFLGLGLSYLCFRSVVVTIMVFFVGGVSALASLSIVWWSGASVDAVLMSMPSLVYVLGLSGAVHIVNYYRDAALEHGVRGAPERALSHGWWPCTLAAFTTSLGLLSLLTSNILPIRKFGLFSAIGVMATLALLFTYLPSALETWSPNYHKRRGEDGEPEKLWLQAQLDRFWERMGLWIIGRHWWVTAVCLLLLVGFGWGLRDINTSVQLLKLFDQDAKIIRDYHWLESHLGKLVPMELVVRVEPEMLRPATSTLATKDSRDVAREQLQLSFLERMEIADRVQQVVEEKFGEQGVGIVGGGMSAATFAPTIPPPAFGFLNNQRIPLNTELEQHREEILGSDYLRVDRKTDEELWRVSLRLGALNNVDYGSFVNELKSAVEPVMSAYRYRNEILRSLIEQPEGKNLVRSNVYLLGVAKPQPGQPEVEPAEHLVAITDEAGPNLKVPPVKPGEQTNIFVRTLQNLLVNRGLERRLGWHDPEQYPLTEGLAQSDQWAQQLAKQDVVVLVEDHPDYDLDFIRRHAKVFIDARGHHFEPASPAAQTAAQEGSPIDVIYTGVVPVVYKAQRTLLNSLIDSIGLAFVMIAVVMMFLLRTGPLRPTNVINLRGGMVSMLPNVFPVVLIFGAMGHMGVLVDIGSMMTASVAMGVAVDDTIHFLNWFRKGIRQGMTRRQAILKAYGRCAAAMTQTTVIGGLGLAVFAFSTFTPTQRFGVLMLTLLATALVGDLIFLPALLAGPLGRFFERREGRRGDGPSSDIASQPASEQSVEGASATATGGDATRNEADRHAPRGDTPHSAARRDEFVARRDQRHN